jgi:hypothetical protein
MAAELATYDPLQSIELLTDVSAAEFVATQLNDGAQNQNVAMGAPTVKDLTEAIADLTVETIVQGAGTLTALIIDPWWQLLTRSSDGSAPAFIDVDESGLLIPVDVNFPSGTDCWWRLCAAQPTTDTSQANLTLTFEDRIATELRDLGGPKTAGSGQTRAQFIASCVSQAPDIRFVCPALTQPAGSVAGDITSGQILALGNTSAPASSTQPTAPTARRHPTKKASGNNVTPQSQGAVWTPNGWKYPTSIDGMSPKELSVLNPPTNQPDQSILGADSGPGPTIAGRQGLS